MVRHLSGLVSSQPESDSLEWFQKGEEFQWEVGVSSGEGHSGEPSGLVHGQGIKGVGSEDDLGREEGTGVCVCVCVCVCVHTHVGCVSKATPL